MKRGFYTIMAAQFFSSLADNALLIAAIAMLLELQGPPWMTPLLKFFYTVSYVALAAFVGAFADALPKGRVMFITNTVKIVGCAMTVSTAIDSCDSHPVATRRTRFATASISCSTLRIRCGSRRPSSPTALCML